MKILHCSDWHLGKRLGDFSLLEEQAAFMDELVDIVEDREIDLIVVPGDIFDVANPPARAEELFFDGIKRLSGEGTRPVVITSGNHDSGVRLQASSPIAVEQGVYIVGSRETDFKPFSNGHFSFTPLGEGVLSFTMNNEELIILALPYLNERTLNEVVSAELNLEDMQEGSTNKTRELLEEMSVHYKEDAVHLVMGHFFITHDNVRTSESETPLRWGGSFAVESDVFPKGTDYVAMGHLHQAQTIPNTGCEAYYSGSPLPFSKSESNKKSVYIVETDNNQVVDVERVMLSVYKPVSDWVVNSIEDALEKIEDNEGVEQFVFLTIRTHRSLTADERRAIHKGTPDIVEMKLELYKEEDREMLKEKYQAQTMEEEFIDFHKSKHGIEPDEDLLSLFSELMEEDQSEAD